MTSLRKIQANRANARTSTGPKRAQSKARTARNARRHGLSLSVFADPVLSEQVEAIAREIAGGPTDDNTYHLARRVAEAQIDLQRVRQTPSIPGRSGEQSRYGSTGEVPEPNTARSTQVGYNSIARG
jgi:hypothetical protein